MKVLFVTTEMDDFVRVGGLAAVSAALPRALRALERRPDHAAGLSGRRRAIHPHSNRWPMRAAGAKCRPARWGGHRPGTACRSMCCCARNSTTAPAIPMAMQSGRDWPDNDIRFGRFASAAAELAAGTLDKNWAADLVHANDWQAALVPAYLAWNAVKIPTILTIHNLAYQGLFPKESLRRIGAPEDLLPYRRPRILRQIVLPQGRHRLRLASDHRQRDLCPGDHHAANSAAGSRACCASAPTPRN